MRLPDFCNCDRDTSTCSNVRLSRRHALSHVPRAPEPRPPRATRVVAHLTMRGPASAKTATPLRRQTRVRAPFAPGGISRSTDPSNGAPPQRRFRPCAGRATQPLTLPVATNEITSAARTDFTTAPSRAVVPSDRSAFHRRVLARRACATPRTRARHRAQDFAVLGQLPTLFRPPLARRKG